MLIHNTSHYQCPNIMLFIIINDCFCHLPRFCLNDPRTFHVVGVELRGPVIGGLDATLRLRGQVRGTVAARPVCKREDRKSGSVFRRGWRGDGGEVE